MACKLLSTLVLGLHSHPVQGLGLCSDTPYKSTSLTHGRMFVLIRVPELVDRTFTLKSLTALVRPKAVERPPGPPPMMTTSQSRGLAVIAQETVTICLGRPLVDYS